MRRTQQRRNSKVMSVISGIFCILFGVIWFQVSRVSGAPAIFALVGIVIIVLPVIQILKDLNIIKRK